MKNITLNELPEILTTKEVAEYLRFSTSHVNVLAKSGKIQAFGGGQGGYWRFKKSDLIKFLK